MSQDGERARRLLEDLVRTYSPSGAEDEAAQVLSSHLDALGLDVRRDAVGNVLARRPGAREDAPRVLLLGHIDTVPGELPVRWQGETLAGRGTVDAKGPLAAHALALARLPEDVDLDARLVAAVGEEDTSRGARHLRASRPEPDALVIAEPTGRSTVGLGYKGRIHGRLVARARPAHPGAPGATASERLLEAVDTLTRWTGNPGRDPGFDATTLRVTDLGTRSTAEVERAEATIDLRFPGSPPDLTELSDRLPEAVEVVAEDSVPAVRADPANPIATALRGALIASGAEPRSAVKTGTSDWNVVASAWQTPGVAYGPGDPSLDHTPDEAIALGAVSAAAEVLADALVRFARHRAAGETPGAGARQPTG